MRIMKTREHENTRTLKSRHSTHSVGVEDPRHKMSGQKDKKIEQGFTLVETMVVVALLGIVGIMAVNVFFTSLRGSAKAEILKEVKQNGDFAISAMGGMIRNARDITSQCDNSPQPSLIVVNPDYSETTFLCDLTAGQIASNSGFLTSDKLMIADSDCSFICTPQGRGQKKIDIKFSLSQEGLSLRPEDKASLTFQTTVYTRSYSH